MRLASIETDQGPEVVAVAADEVVLLDGAGEGIPKDIPGVLAAGSAALERIQAAIDSGRRRVALAEVRLAAPIPHPGKFLAVGLNYADHVAESGVETPEFATVFAKLPSCVVGPYDDVQRPLLSEAVDYEGELAFVIGRRCRHVSAEDAHEVIGGYLVVNDVSVRDYQWRTSQWILGKSFDTHGVLGPWIATADEVGDPHALEIRTTVNGETRQHSNTSNLIHNCFALVELISSVCTLEPGDIVATGTPGGVGMAADPPQWLRAGDVVEVEIQHLGATRNTIVSESSNPYRGDGRAPVGASGTQ